MVGETTSQNEAERISKSVIGSTIRREAGARANLKVGSKQVKVPSDFQNSEHSPIHDEQGTAHRLHYEEGMPEESITRDIITEYEEMQAAIEADPEAWKYS